MPQGLSCVSRPFLSPFSLETNPTSEGLSVRSHTRSKARTTSRSSASNNTHGASRKMRVPRVVNFWVNQITITPLSWSVIGAARLSDIKQQPAQISGYTLKNPLCRIEKSEFGGHHGIDPHICRSSFFSDRPWYLVTAQPWGSLLDFSWARQGCEPNLWRAAWWIWLSMCGRLYFFFPPLSGNPLSVPLSCSQSNKGTACQSETLFTLKEMSSNFKYMSLYIRQGNKALQRL